MNKKSLTWSIVFFLCSLVWGYVAYTSYTEANVRLFYLQMMVAAGFLINAVVEMHKGGKNQ